jgi:rubrerythrin
MGTMTPTDGSESSADVKRHLANWQDEIDSVALYGALAELESDPRLVDVYRRLAAAEDRHAGFWEHACPSAGRAGAPAC